MGRINLTSITEEYLIVEISKKSYAINTCYIESIHSSASIKFNEELNRCLPLPETDWDKSYPVFTLKNTSNNENTTSFSKHSSQIFLPFYRLLCYVHFLNAL